MLLGYSRMSFSPKIPDYDLIKLIGEGGFGQIWMGKDALGLYRAIKIIRYDDSKSLESYQAEHNGIRHYAPYSRKYDGLIDIHHVGIREEEGFYYYVMDLADDLYLDDHVAEDYQPKTLRAHAHGPMNTSPANTSGCAERSRSFRAKLLHIVSEFAFHPSRAFFETLHVS